LTNWWRNLFMGKKRAASPDSRRYRPAVEPLESRTVPTVTYHGGALMPHVEAQAIYLGADWNNAALQPQTRTLDGFLASLVNGPYMDNLSMAGYGVGRGSANPGRVDPFILMPGYTLTDAAIQRDLQSAVTNGLVRSPDANRLYVVFVQPNVAVRASDGSVSRTDFLGYHGAFTGYDGTGHATNIRYAGCRGRRRSTT